MSNEKKSEPTAFELLVAEKISAGLPRKDAEICAQQQLDHDAALAAAAKATETASSKAKK